MDVRVGLWRRLSAEELMLLNCGATEDSWESLVQQGDQPINAKGKPSWIFIGRIDAEADALILRPPDVKSWLIGKDPDAGKNWRQEKGTTEDEMVGWHHQLNGYEFEQTSGESEGQGSLACFNPWGRRVSYDLSTEQLILRLCLCSINGQHNLDDHTSVYNMVY